MWVFLALAAAVCFAVVHLLDEYCIDEIFERPWIGVITSAVASLVVIAPLPFVLPIIGWEWPSNSIMLLAIGAGILIQISQLLYFNALANTNAGIVAAYWNIIPAILPILSFSIFGNILTPYQYIGIVILIFASNMMLLSDHNLETRTSAFIFMVGASLLQAISYLIQDFVYENTQYVTGFTLLTCGIILVGVIPLIFTKVRSVLAIRSGLLNSSFKLFICIEIINLAALAFAQKSIQEGIPSLVAAVETTMPGFTFIIGLLIVSFFKVKYDTQVFLNLWKKYLALSMMILGVYLVS
ncbi:hypothetical protein A3C37_02910 [Candidatus Peribacteria bacterium RIFCSPHIGHO2_02_FULL_53_20]|nr:MAG: hypothetical protein A3C37_02910 [Candidatus Peribacteria bacterium RIFCSPHIGHO2_02_FULL_53_20]